MHTLTSIVLSKTVLKNCEEIESCFACCGSVSMQQNLLEYQLMGELQPLVLLLF